ncbi:unnamed protein product [Caenorhabditis sp. 36 PRJEB53466]|nr:unnamed protein product [Caenorhabditis sp. 36 PRJEB53466]
MEASASFQSLNTNLNSEMSDLVHQAEEWAIVPTEEPRAQWIMNQVLTRAAVILLEQMGIKTGEEFEKHFGAQIREEKELEVARDEVAHSAAVSPMSVEEFQSILKNGWAQLDEPLSGSLFHGRRRTSMLADLIPMSPIVSECSQMSPEKKRSPPQRVAEKAVFEKPLFVTSTPKPKRKTHVATPNFPMRRTNSMPGTPRRRRRETITVTPIKATSSSRLDKYTPMPMEGETPLENRASRLRRMKLEETMGRLNNSSFGSSSFLF